MKNPRSAIGPIMFPGILRVFYEAVRLHSIRKAGEALGLSPSAVSRQIALFEHRIGTPLFDRSAKGVVLNHAGEMVADFARTVLLDFDALKTDLDDYKGGRRAMIRIATVEGMVAAGPAGAIVEFRRKFPRVLFEVRMMPAPAVIDAVLRAEADIGLGFSPEVHPDLVTKSLIREPLLLVAPKNGNLALGASVSLSDLAGMPLALPGPEFGFRRMIDAACRKGGFEVAPVFSSNAFETLRDFVVQGGGCSVLPSRALRGKDNSKLQWAPIEDPRLGKTTVEVLVLRKRKLSRVLRLFLDGLGKALDE